MSAWRVLVRNLYAQGGGPLPMQAFDPILGQRPDMQMQSAKRLGLVESRRVKFTWTWTLTQRGRDWCEGRVEVVETVNRGRGIGGRGKLKGQATWLQAMPRPGEVRL